MALTRFPEHCLVTSPPSNQKKVTHPAALTPNFAYKNFSLKTIREFGFFEYEPPIFLGWPCNKPFSAQKKKKKKKWYIDKRLERNKTMAMC